MNDEIKAKVKLKIGGIVIQLRSASKLRKQLDNFSTKRFSNFIYTGQDKPDIAIDINLVRSLPRISQAKELFTTYGLEGVDENWRFFKKRDCYIYSCMLEEREQVIWVNKDFTRVTANMLRKAKKRLIWKIEDIVYDFVQVLLINYLALRQKGVIVHSMGIKDSRYGGIVFAGKSGAGKSTLARIWHKAKGAMVLNDDRIIICRERNGFLIHGSPWHGNFQDYFKSRIESAPLASLIFIYHAPKNTARRISANEALKLLYPVIFPVFWDRDCLKKTLLLCHKIVSSADCYRMGFVNDKLVIAFVREVCQDGNFR